MGFIALLLILELFIKKNKARIFFQIACVGFCIEIASLFFAPDKQAIGQGMLYVYPVVTLFKAVFAITGILTIIFEHLLKKSENKTQGEWYMLILALVFGANLMLMARHLLMVYVAMESVSIVSYLLAAWRKNHASSAEVSLKYILFGAFSSACMLYGLSWMYGSTGSLQINADFNAHFHTLSSYTQLLILLLFFAGLFFKVSVFPFHAWIADVYDGVSYPTAALFAVVPKLAGFVLWMHILSLLKLDNEVVLLLFAILSIATMTFGNVTALAQQHIKRLLAFSSIAHSGFLLMALLPQNTFSNSAFLFYLIVYALMNFLAFFITAFIAESIESEQIEDFKGIGQAYPFFTISFILCMVALIGLPPTAGFTSKWFVFIALWQQWSISPSIIWIVLLVAAILNTVVALYYYLRVPALMLFSPSIKTIQTNKKAIPLLLVSLLSLPLFILGIYGFDKCLDWFGKALLLSF